MNRWPSQLQCCAAPSTFAGQPLHLVYHHNAGAAAMPAAACCIILHLTCQTMAALCCCSKALLQMPSGPAARSVVHLYRIEHALQVITYFWHHVSAWHFLTWYPVRAFVAKQLGWHKPVAACSPVKLAGTAGSKSPAACTALQPHSWFLACCVVFWEPEGLCQSVFCRLVSSTH